MSQTIILSYIIINALWACPKPQPIYYTPVYYGRIPIHTPSSLYRPCGIFNLQNELLYTFMSIQYTFIGNEYKLVAFQTGAPHGKSWQHGVRF